MATVLKYFAQKTQDGYPIPSTMMGFKQAPTADLVEIQPKNYVALPGQTVLPSASGMRYFVRHKADGSILPNSLITGTKKPAGKVYEFKLISGSAIAAPSNYVYGQTSYQFMVGIPFPSQPPTITGTVTSYSVSPALPAGLSLNTTTGAITGPATAASEEAQYVFTATNAGGSTSCTVTIFVGEDIGGPL